MSLDVYLIDKQCKHCGRGEYVYEANITHNLHRMAEEAGVYDIVWCPEENGIETAVQLVEPLKRAIDVMRVDPERFKQHDSPNGWGVYEHFLPWLERYLVACVAYPEAAVRASR